MRVPPPRCPQPIDCGKEAGQRQEGRTREGPPLSRSRYFPVWMTMLPPPICWGLAPSMSSEAPATLS
jgi:hypothetical protein